LLVGDVRLLGSKRGDLGRPLRAKRSAFLAASFALRQRAATAWCALLHADQPNKKRLRPFGSAIAKTNRLTSGTVGGISLVPRPPF
jgi:hypothetical protein